MPRRSTGPRKSRHDRNVSLQYAALALLTIAKLAHGNGGDLSLLARTPDDMVAQMRAPAGARRGIEHEIAFMERKNGHIGVTGTAETRRDPHH